MQTLKELLLIILVAGVAVSCKKDKGEVMPVSSLNVINASPGITNAKVRTPNVAGYYKQLTGVAFGRNAVFTVPAGSCSVTIANVADTTKPFYATAFNSNAGDIYSLFIGGSGGNDIVLNKDMISYQADSTFGVRFVNMSYNSTPVNVNLSTTSTTNEFSNVAYKSITDFKVYNAHSTAPGSYVFQVRDASGNLLVSSPAISRTNAMLLNHNITLVLKGAVGGSGTTALGVFIVNNY